MYTMYTLYTLYTYWLRGLLRYPESGSRTQDGTYWLCLHINIERHGTLSVSPFLYCPRLPAIVLQNFSWTICLVGGLFSQNNLSILIMEGFKKGEKYVCTHMMFLSPKWHNGRKIREAHLTP